MIIQANVTALKAYNDNYLSKTQTAKAIEKLSSGYRINRAADDAAGLGVSESMRAQITEMNRCISNTTEGISLTDATDGALGNMTSLLQRARELCLVASNEILNTEDLEGVETEIKGIYAEVDRICKSSNFNGVQLFQGIGKMTIEDHVTIFPNTDLQDWKDLEFINEQIFDKAKPAIKASKEIDIAGFATSADLLGKSFSFTDALGNKQFFQFYDKTAGKNSIPPCPSGYTNVAVEVDGTKTVKEVLEGLRFNNATGKVNTAGDKFVISHNTMSAENDLTSSIPPYFDIVDEADGLAGNKASIGGVNAGKLENVGVKLPIDEILESTYVLSGGTSALSASDLSDNLAKNTMYIGGYTFSFTAGTNTANHKFIDLSAMASPSKNDIFNAMQTAMGSDTTIKFDTTTNIAQCKITYTAKSPQHALDSNIYISESISTTGGTSPVYEKIISSFKPAPTNVSAKKPVNAEGRTEFTIDLGAVKAGESFSLSVAGKNGGSSTAYFYFYDSSVPNGNKASLEYSYGYGIDLKNATTESISNLIKNHVTNANEYILFDAGKSNMSGGKLVFQHKDNGQDHTGDIVIGAAPSNSYQYIKTPGTAGTSTKRILVPNGGYTSVTTPIELDFSAYTNSDGSLKDMDKLVGHGFRYQGKIFELYTDPKKKREGSIGIDIKGLTTIEDLAKKIGNAINININQSASGAAQQKAPPYNGKININITTTTSSSSPSVYSRVTDFVDGVPGLEAMFGVGEQKLEGGTFVKAPQTIIDFKDVEDAKSLHGTGFRVTCATCAGEYINVLFRNGSKPPAPTSFEITTETGEKRTIQNVIIDISKTSTPEEIVLAINTQANPKMEHFTEFGLDPNHPTQLISRDKRWGDIVDNGNPLQAKVIPGVATNFILDTIESETRVQSNVKIFVGSHPEPQYIDIHLPLLSLEELYLDDPEIDLQNSGCADEWNARTYYALMKVNDARGVIGGDHNRLEHAQSQISSVHVQTSQAESTIRDADMAKEMSKLVAFNVMQESSQAMLAQANKLPQQVMELLK